MSRRTHDRKTESLGCGYLVKLTVLISLLMLINSAGVGYFVRALVPLLPEVLDDVRLYQFFQIFLPILIIGIQFWIYDRWKDRRLTQTRPES